MGMARREAFSMSVAKRICLNTRARHRGGAPWRGAPQHAVAARHGAARRRAPQSAPQSALRCAAARRRRGEPSPRRAVADAAAHPRAPSPRHSAARAPRRADAAAGADARHRVRRRTTPHRAPAFTAAAAARRGTPFDKDSRVQC